MPQILWTRNFLLTQGVEVAHNILHQDNKSAMILEENGNSSSSRRTRHINVRFFFIKDRISNNEVELQYCPTEQMVGDYFTKPLQGKFFFFFRKLIMGEDIMWPSKECVGINMSKEKIISRGSRYWKESHENTILGRNYEWKLLSLVLHNGVGQLGKWDTKNGKSCETKTVMDVEDVE